MQRFTVNVCVFIPIVIVQEIVVIQRFLRVTQAAFDTAPVKMFIFIGYATGILYVLGTPPYYLLDEPNHLFRAYQVSEGAIVPQRIENKTGGDIPRSMSTSVYVFRFGIQQYEDGTIPVSLIRESLALPLNEDDASFVAFSNTAVYSPLPYIPQAIGIGIGRALDLSPLVLLYLGRFANLFVAILILAIAMRILPVYRWVMFLLVLSPTSMFQLASLSADATLIALSFLFIALVLRITFEPAGSEPPSMKTYAGLLLLSMGIAFCKSAYFALPLLVLLIPAARVGGWVRLIGLSLLLVFVQFFVAGLWGAIIQNVYTPFLNPLVDPTASVQWILSHPLSFAGVLAADVAQHVWFYIQGLFSFQWNQQEILLPQAFTVGYLSVLLITAVLSGEEFVSVSKMQRGILVAFAVVSVVVLLTGVYVTWMEPGSLSLEGVQGRYFLPILLPVLLIMYTRKFALRAVESSLSIILPIFSFVSLMYALVMFHRLF